MAAAVADFRPADAGRRQAQEGPGGDELDASRSSATAGRPQRRWPARRAPGQTLVGFAAEHGDGRRRLRPRQARAQGPGRGRRQRHLARRTSASTAPTTRSRSSPPTGERARRRAPPRPRSRARSSTRSSSCARRREPRAMAWAADQRRSGAGHDRGARSRAEALGAPHRANVAARRRGPRRRCSTTCSSRSSPRATSSSRTCRASARRRSPARSPRSIDLQFARIQCTADLLPADVVGTNVFNQREDRFEFRPGPIFANVVLVDEINRASPKTQSGLLECMQERRVTVDVHTHELARPFLVLATQNPVEYEGTYPLPEAQVDRFMVRLSLGYPSPRRRGRHARRPRGRRPRRARRAGRRRRRPARRAGRRRPRARLRRAARRTSSRCSRARARTRGSSSAPARAPA